MQEVLKEDFYLTLGVLKNSDFYELSLIGKQDSMRLIAKVCWTLSKHYKAGEMTNLTPQSRISLMLRTMEQDLLLLAGYLGIALPHEEMLQQLTDDSWEVPFEMASGYGSWVARLLVGEHKGDSADWFITFQGGVMGVTACQPGEIPEQLAEAMLVASQGFRKSRLILRSKNGLLYVEEHGAELEDHGANAYAYIESLCLRIKHAWPG